MVGDARARTLTELRTTNLEWTRFNNGYFLDCFGPSTLKSYMQPVVYALDVKHKAAGIPGTGNEPMSFTYTFDVARFLLAALDLPKWEEEMYCYGEKTTWIAFLKAAEDARGKTISILRVSEFFVDGPRV
jgi:nucleoside-diphosphate-sugar epimerase